MNDVILNLIPKNHLLVIDIQKEFKDKNGNYEKIIDYINKNRDAYDDVIAVYTTGEGTYKPTQVGKIYVPGFGFKADESSIEYEFDRAISKTGYAVPIAELDNYDYYTIVGCESDACVLASTFALYDAGYNFIVLQDYIYTNANDIEQSAIQKIYDRQFKGCLR